FQEIARDYLEPLRRCGIDTLVLGCTHYPLLTPLITSIIGPAVQIISSATETAHDVRATLTERGELAGESARVQQRFATTGWDLAEFQALGSAILGQALPQPESVSLATLAAFQQFVRA
ncbi:MAG: glutamate racemase, partial [Actinomycetia bacterium]|nr:glutamate racemase [Actinomycetes bacterium]